MHGHLNVKFDISVALGAISFWSCVNFGQQIAGHSVIFQYNILQKFHLDWQLTLIVSRQNTRSSYPTSVDDRSVSAGGMESNGLFRTMNLHLNPNIQDTLHFEFCSSSYIQSR